MHATANTKSTSNGAIGKPAERHRRDPGYDDSELGKRRPLVAHQDQSASDGHREIIEMYIGRKEANADQYQRGLSFERRFDP